MFTIGLLADRTIIAATSGHAEFPTAVGTAHVDALPAGFQAWLFRLSNDGSVVPIASAVSPTAFIFRLPSGWRIALRRASRLEAVGTYPADPAAAAIQAGLADLWDTANDVRINDINMSDPRIVSAVTWAQTVIAGATVQERDAILATGAKLGET